MLSYVVCVKLLLNKGEKDCSLMAVLLLLAVCCMGGGAGVRGDEAPMQGG